MKFAEFKERVEAEYRKILPDSSCNVMVYKCLGKSVTIDCHLAGKIEEVPNRILANDMFSIGFMFSLPDNFNQEEDELPEEIILTASRKSYRIKPESKWMYCGMKNLNYRKTKGDAEKIIKAIGKFFAQLKSSLEEDLSNGNIHPDNIKLVKEKLSNK